MAGKARTLLHRIFQRAVALELTVRNPVAAVEAPRAPKHEMRFFTAAQLAKLFKAATGDRLEALAVLLATSGLRIGEALALTWADVDLRGRTLRVTKQAQDATGAPRIVEPKNGGRPAFRRAHVDRDRCAAPTLQARTGRRLRKADDLVFPTSTGTVPGKSNLRSQWWLPLLVKAKLPSIRLHDLRHSSATLSLAAGTNAKVVADRLGHTNAAFTMKQYRRQRRRAAPGRRRRHRRPTAPRRPKKLEKGSKSLEWLSTRLSCQKRCAVCFRKSLTASALLHRPSDQLSLK